MNHWLWIEKPFSKFEAWIWLLLHANFKDNKVNLGFELHEVKRGQFITSQEKLSDHFGWSRQQVRSFLDLLKVDGMISHESTTKFTMITICNYDSYQASQPTNNQPKNNETTTTRQRPDNESPQIKNVNNGNNEKELLISFELFWDLYDKKRGREKCERLWSDLSSADRDLAMAYIPKYKLEFETKYRKDPERFIKKKCWNDELVGEKSQIKTIRPIRPSDYYNHADYCDACKGRGITPLSQLEFEEAAKPKAKIA